MTPSSTVGPDAPTLCSPWTTADLAAHLVIRERRPDLAPGIWMPPLAGRLEDGQADYAAKPWPELVELVRSGPPSWSPTQLASVDDAVNFVEFFIHHEDVLRGDGRSARDASVPLREQKALWKTLKRMGKAVLPPQPRRRGAGAPDGKTARRPGRDRPRHGDPAWEASELVLAAYGRRRVADLEVTGSDEAVEALWAAPLGLA